MVESFGLCVDQMVVYLNFSTNPRKPGLVVGRAIPAND